MNPLSAADFENYFRELYGRSPYDWQQRLLERAVGGKWPGAIDLPTGSGKTACLDIAVFALACQASLTKTARPAPRRIFFCVNRRVIVDEAARRAEKIARAIWQADSIPDSGKPTLRRVAAGLRSLAGHNKPNDRPPLDVLELRGGIYRDNRWARSATQPTIICTTIDQLGSRLLFRGYGVSANAASVQAALIAYESLILLDEAHISEPFRQTLKRVEFYLDPVRWAKQSVGVRPMVVVPMTATPPDGIDNTEVIRLSDQDRQNTSLNNRLKADKWARLLSVDDVVRAATFEAKSASKDHPVAVGIIVNRVATAKAIYQSLRDAHPDTVVELVIGSMRPVDRDCQAERLRTTVGPNRPEVTEKASFVVATQCLEVGADYDFDVLVTECASLDALRQRFGRLNRNGRQITAQAVILIHRDQVKTVEEVERAKPSDLDPIYGKALPKTWNWLNEQAEGVTVELDEPPTANFTKRKSPAKKPKKSNPAAKRINFGIDAFKPKYDSLEEEDRKQLSAPSASLNAPVMLPTYVDFWCQTSPQPVPDPEVALFIHGPQSGEPDVSVCWRADLVEDGDMKKSLWCDVVGLLSPTAAECMSVPISRVRRWLTQEDPDLTAGDLLGVKEKDADGEEDKGGKRRLKKLDPQRAGVLWRGSREGSSKVIESPDELRPGDTLVLPVSARGWDDLGHIPPNEPRDTAEAAFRVARDRAVLRLHPVLRDQFPGSAVFGELLDRIGDSDESLSLEDLRGYLLSLADDLATISQNQEQPCRDLANRRFGLRRDSYPDNRGVVITTRRRLESNTDWYLPTVDEGEDDRCRTEERDAIRLDEHTRHVREEVERIVGLLPLDLFQEAYSTAAQLHDVGKSDERFQAMLRRTDRTDVWLLTGLESALLAKSDGVPLTPKQRREARLRADLPDGFRHEMLSVQAVEHGQLVRADDPHRTLILHLIAAHHGYARPFAPISEDNDPPGVVVAGVTMTKEDRLLCPSHRLDSGIAERFWVLTRRFGWWGVAYLEAVLRLADQQASADEDARNFESERPELELVGGKR